MRGPGQRPRLALVTTRKAIPVDQDLPLLAVALRELQVTVETPCWDDPSVEWSRFELALIRSTWNYTTCYPAFLAWLERAAAATRLFNPLPVLRWNTDKHYLEELARQGLPVVPTRYLEPGDHPLLPEELGEELVIKPAVSAGAKDTARYQLERSGQRDAALRHLTGLLEQGRSVLVQPFLPAVEERGETALIFFDGAFDHAIRKGPILRPGPGEVQGLFAAEEIRARLPSQAELQAGGEVLRALASLPALRPHLPLLYARVDLIPDGTGRPQLLELELTEPSLFLDEQSAARLAGAVLGRLSGQPLRV